MIESSFKKAGKIIEKIEKAGFEAFIVGGAVRDKLLNRAVHDIDIATSALPNDIMRIFPKTFPTGIEHGTVLVRYEQESFEITTFRTEKGYSDYRRPDEVQFVTSLREDLARRDFTINAMAFSKDQRLIDPFNGKSDLAHGIIRTVGEASQRFKEDGLRMMRAIRFSAQLNFHIDESTLIAIKQHAYLLKKISVERLADEWGKLIVANGMRQALHSIENTKLSEFLPIFKEHNNLLALLLKQEEPFISLEEFISYIHLSCPSITISDWIREWKLSNRIKQDTKHLVAIYHQYDREKLKWIAYQLSPHLIQSFSSLIRRMGYLQKVDFYELQESLPIRNRRELVINGTDLIQLFPNKRPGAWLEEMLVLIEKQVVLGKLKNEKKVIGEWLIKWHQNVTS